MKTVSKWLAAAALLCVTAGGVQAQDVDLPTQGTTEYNLSGSIVLDPTSSWLINGLWAPFVNQNFQWGIGISLFDADAIDTSGTVRLIGNYHFVPSSGNSKTLPYLGLGIGTAFGDLDGTIWDIHGGVKFFMSSETSFNVELQFVDPSEGDNVTQILFGISVYRR